MYSLDFKKLIFYDSGKRGITVDVILRISNSTANIQAKVDTDAEACIFARNIAEELGIDIENGERQYFSTATDSFLTYGHSVNLKAADIEFDS